MGSDESHFNVSLIVMDKVKRQCPQTATFFEEKGEPKRYRTEVLRGGGRGRLYTYRYTVTTTMTDSCIKMGIHFNVSVGSDGQSHRTVSTNHNLF